MATVRGLFTTSDYESGIRKLDVRDTIFELQPNEAPFVSILKRLPKKSAQDMTIYWFEDDLLGNYTRINLGAGYLSTALVMVVDDASIFQEAEVVLNTTSDERMLITNVDPTANTITVVRGWGTTAAAAVVDNDYIFKLGPAMAEGYDVPDALVTAKTQKTNYLQIFSKAVKITETADAIATYGGNRRDFERNKKGRELKREIESQLLWGEPKLDTTSGGEPRYQTGGVYYFLGSVAPTLDMSSAALTESAFEGWLRDVFLYSDEDRVLFTGPLVMSQISQWASAKQRMQPGTTIKYGIKVRTYHSANGDVHITSDRHFVGPHAGKGVCLAMSDIVYRFLNGFDFTLHLNKQPNNSHYLLDEYTSTIGLEFRHALHHGILKGVA